MKKQYTRKQIAEALAYWRNEPKKLAEADDPTKNAAAVISREQTENARKIAARPRNFVHEISIDPDIDTTYSEDAKRHLDFINGERPSFSSGPDSPKRTVSFPEAVLYSSSSSRPFFSLFAGFPAVFPSGCRSMNSQDSSEALFREKKEEAPAERRNREEDERNPILREKQKKPVEKTEYPVETPAK